MNEQQKPDYAKYQQTSPGPAQPGYVAVQPYPQPQAAHRERRPLAPLILLGIILAVSLLLAVGTGVLSLPGQAKMQQGSIAAAPNLRVEGDAGNIRLIATNGNTISVEATYNNGFLNSDAGQMYTISRSGDTVSISLRQDNRPFALSADQVNISVPGNTAVELSTGSSDVVVSDLQAGLKANVGSGNLKLANIQGDLDINTGSGNIDVKNISGGNLRAQAGSGNLKIEGAKPQGSTYIQVGSGNVEYRGSLADGGNTFKTGSGNLKAYIPAGSSFKLTTSTGSGEFKSDFGVGGKDYSGNIGSNPTSSVEMSSGSGNIELGKEQ